MENNNCNLNKPNNKNTEELNKNNLNNKEIDYEEDNNPNEVSQLESSNHDSGTKNISKNKIEKIISLDTLVYEISPGENRNKNYEKISLEIKNVEQMAKIEKAKLRKKINIINKRLNNNKENKENNDLEGENENDNNNENAQSKILNLQMKQLMMMEYERDKKYNFIEVIQKLKIPPEKRTIRDILRIKTYFEQSKLGLNFKDEFTDNNIVEKLIHFCCIEMRYQKYKKDETIIQIGSPPDFFYSIIFGKVKAIKPVPKDEELTGFQYFKYLMNMKKKNEDYIFRECIKNNKNDFHIELNDGEIIRYIYLLIYLEHIKANNEPTIDLDKVLDLLNLKPEELGINPESVNNNYYIHDNLNKILKKIPYISPDIIEQYSFIFDNITKKEVTIYEYKQFLSLKANDYFGDSSIETNTPRNSTIIAEEDTDIAYLSNKLYSIQIASEKALLLQIKIKNLHQNYFFHRIKYYKFSKKYFTWFINEKYSKGDIIFNEDEKVKFLYFIQEGSVELSTSKNMTKIEELINLINEKKELLIRNNYTDINLNNLKKYYIENKIREKENNLYEYNPINSTYNDIVEYINQKQNNKIIILNTNEDLGIISFFLGNTYLSTCKVVSRYAKIYKIDTDYLNQMLESEIEIKWDFYNRLKRKMQLFSERLFKINNIKLIMTDENITKNKMDQKKIEEKDITYANNSNIKASINYDKINYLLNESNDINKNNNMNTFNNSKIKIKNEINFPTLNNSRNKNKYNFSLSSINNDKDEFKLKHNSFRVNKLIKKGLKFNNIKLFNILNQKEKEKEKIISKKPIIEDNLLSKLHKDLISFSQNRYTLSKDRILLEQNKNYINKNNISDSADKKNDQVYLTELSYNNAQYIKYLKYKEIGKNEYNNEKKASLSPHILEKVFEMPDGSMSLESPRNINYRSLSIDYKRFNTENNIIIYNNNSNKIIKGNNIRLYKRYNHPYYDPLTLIKKEKYKIFDNTNISNKFKNDNLNSHIERIRELKRLRAYMKNNFKLRFKVNNINEIK